MFREPVEKPGRSLLKGCPDSSKHTTSPSCLRPHVAERIKVRIRKSWDGGEYVAQSHQYYRSA